MPVTLPDGKTGLQPSRVIGINGPRWLLRATLLGRPAVEPDAGTTFEDALTTVAVRRGAHAMPVGDPLALSLPGGRPQERRLTVPDPDECPDEVSPRRGPGSRLPEKDSWPTPRTAGGRAGCAGRSAGGPTAPTSTPGSCGRPSATRAWSRSPRRPTGPACS